MRWCSSMPLLGSSFFFFNDTATTEIYTLSLHDALPILLGARTTELLRGMLAAVVDSGTAKAARIPGLSIGGKTGTARSEEHTSELQSLAYLVCRLLLEKKKLASSRNCMMDARPSPCSLF